MPDRKDHDMVMQVMRQFYAQQAPKTPTVKLPCGHSYIEVTNQDSFVQCPQCKKKYLYNHAMRSEGRHLYEK